MWLKSLEIFLSFTQVVIGITALKPFKVKIILYYYGSVILGLFPWSILDQTPMIFLSNPFELHYGVNKENYFNIESAHAGH